MQMAQRARAVEEYGDDADLPAEVADVLRRAAVVLGNDLVAVAVIADRIAERPVHVHRQPLRRAGTIATRAERGDQLFRAERVGEAIGRRIRGIAGTEAVVLPDQIGIEGEPHGSGRRQRWRHEPMLPARLPRSLEPDQAGARAALTS